VGLVKANGPAAIPASALNLPDNRTCAFLPTLASVEVQVTKQLPASLTAGTHYFLVATSDASATDFGGAWAFIPPAGPVAGAGFGQSFNNAGTGNVYDAEWTYYAVYQVQGTNP
jgi:hypothetical protein